MRQLLIVPCLTLVVCVWQLPGLQPPAQAGTNVPELTSGRWSGGAGMGFLGDTPDGVLEFAFNGHVDYFLTERLSIGPLAQYAGVGNVRCLIRMEEWILVRFAMNAA